MRKYMHPFHVHKWVWKYQYNNTVHKKANMYFEVCKKKMFLI